MGRILLVQTEDISEMSKAYESRETKADKLIKYIDVGSGLIVHRYIGCHIEPQDVYEDKPSQFRIAISTITRTRLEDIYFTDQASVDEFFKIFLNDAVMINTKTWATIIFERDPEEFRRQMAEVRERDKASQLLGILGSIAR